MPEDTWEARMAARAKGRTQRVENSAEFDRVFWRTQNVVFGRDGEILYPGTNYPCPRCGLELREWEERADHPLKPIPEDDELCGECGYHESYHRGHDCVKDAYEPIPCACSGGQPWFCCVNRHARQEQFLFQKIANVLAAAAAR